MADIAIGTAIGIGVDVKNHEVRCRMCSRGGRSPSLLGRHFAARRRTGGTGSQGQVAMFGVLNVGRQDWSNRQQIEHTGTVTLSSLIKSSMKAIEARRLTSPTAIDDPLLIEGQAMQPDLDDLF